ncbi:hypothetical protein N1851_002293 [Merluccius polli]|uniref:Uncharacterized protein n=1 Tax=Merluccius polli TaxID=89951 RepID=A0AA47PCD9_MERPO|nr:hypothetical protein N1851_002293 [Merluccius polli]
MDVSMGGVRVPCLVDTGSMVSTFTESFFLQHFEPWGQERLRSCNWLQLRAANGLAIPYIGYLELDVMLCSKLIPGCGVLVVRDPPGNVSTLVPGVLGMNIIRRCYRELFGQHGLALFNLPAVAEAPESVTQALQKCHQASAPAHRCTTGRVKVRGRKACRIPGGTMKLVVATCSAQYSGISALFEPLDSGLPVGLLASPALVRVVQGTAYIPIVNVGSSAVLLYPRTADSIPVRAADLLSTVPATPLRRLPDTSEAAVRRTTRATAGQHANVHHLPRPVFGCTGNRAADVPRRIGAPCRFHCEHIPVCSLKTPLQELIGFLRPPPDCPCGYRLPLNHGCVEFNKETAVGKKLFLNLLVLVWRLLKRLLEGRSWKSLLAGCEGSLRMLRARFRHCFFRTTSMAGSGVPVMRWAVLTTRCSDLRSATEQFPYQAVIQFVRMLSIAQR